MQRVANSLVLMSRLGTARSQIVHICTPFQSGFLITSDSAYLHTSYCSVSSCLLGDSGTSGTLVHSSSEPAPRIFWFRVVFLLRACAAERQGGTTTSVSSFASFSTHVWHRNGLCPFPSLLALVILVHDSWQYAGHFVHAFRSAAVSFLSGLR